MIVIKNEPEKRKLKKRAAAYNSLACSQYDLGDIAKSLYYYNKSIEADSQYVLSYLCRAHILFETGDLEAALNDCETLLDFTPDYPPIIAMTQNIHRRLEAAQTDVVS